LHSSICSASIALKISRFCPLCSFLNLAYVDRGFSAAERRTISQICDGLGIAEHIQSQIFATFERSFYGTYYENGGAQNDTAYDEYDGYSTRSGGYWDKYGGRSTGGYGSSSYGGGTGYGYSGSAGSGYGGSQSSSGYGGYSSGYGGYSSSSQGSAKSKRDPYEILGLSKDATFSEIKKKYRELVKKYHPDILMGKGADEEIIQEGTKKLQEINEAYKILKLCLFKSNLRDGLITLSEYKEKMGAEQKEIYYIAGNSAAMLKSSPLIEKFNAEGTEVLLCDDEIDTIVMPGVFEFDKTPVKNATSIKQDASEGDAATPQAKEIAAKIKEILGERVKDVKISSRLSGSLSCLVFDENDPDFATQQLLKQMGNRNLPPVRPILEINADHEIVKKLQADKLMLPQVAEIIYDLARLSEGQDLENPSGFIKNVNELIAKAL